MTGLELIRLIITRIKGSEKLSLTLAGSFWRFGCQLIPERHNKTVVKVPLI